MAPCLLGAFLWWGSWEPGLEGVPSAGAPPAFVISLRVLAHQGRQQPRAFCTQPEVFGALGWCELGLRIPVRPALWSQLLRDCPLPPPHPCRRHTHTLVLNTHVHTHSQSHTCTHSQGLGAKPACPPDSWGAGLSPPWWGRLCEAPCWAGPGLGPVHRRALLTTDAGTQALCSGRRHGQTPCGTPLCSLSSRFCPVSSLPASLLFDMFHKKLLFMHRPYCYCSQWGDWPEDLACVPRDRACPLFLMGWEALAAGLAVASASARGKDHTALCWGWTWGSWFHEFGGRGEKSYRTFFLPEESRLLVLRETGNGGQWLISLFLRRLGRKMRE